MNIRDLVERSIEKAGGVRALSRALDWDAASIVKARDDSKLSPYRAARLAHFLGDDVMQAVLAALADTSKSEAEARYWSDMPAAMGSAVGEVAADALVQLTARWEEIGEIPPTEIQAEMLREFLEIELPKRWTFEASTTSTIKSTIKKAG